MKTNPPLRIFKPTVAAALATVIAWGLSVRPAQANSYVVTLEQVGSNVVATGSGPIDLTGLSGTGFGMARAAVQPNVGVISTGPTSFSNEDEYNGFSGPTSFGSGAPRSPAAAAETLSLFGARMGFFSFHKATFPVPLYRTRPPTTTRPLAHWG